MIKNIARIKKFGVFEDYTKPAAHNDFQAINIIYGWNYSGKTTLSRLFQSLEARSIHPDYTAAQFSMNAENGAQIDQSNLGNYGGTTRVFNSEFIEKNLSWDGATFHPILLLGEDTIEAQKTIAANSELIARCRTAYAKHRKLAELAEQRMNADRTAEAKRIKVNLSLVEAFTATHLNALLAGLDASSAPGAQLRDEELSTCLKQALASDKDKLDPVPRVRLQPTVLRALAQCKPLLSKVPQLSSTIEYLRDHPTVANWVEQGLHLHEAAETCEFCGSELTRQRMDALHAHFSKDLLQFKTQLTQAHNAAEALKLQLPPFQKSSFYPDLRDRADRAHRELADAVDLFNAELSILLAAMSRKMASTFEAIECPALSEAPEKEVARLAAALNDVIDANNSAGESFGKIKADAVKKVKRHFAAEFFVREQESGIKIRLALHHSHRERAKDIGEALKNKNLVLEAQISQAQKGRESINDQISSLLGSNEIQIEVVKEVDTERFRLTRRGLVAKNLSEGEKTAIAFSFFLTKLRELKDFSKSIVYIDDPISSLDSNHIFQVNSIIRETFLVKETASNQWKTTCGQLFISTHNFEFFSLLREFPGNGTRYFQTKRTSPTVSTFTNLPASILKYSSEYHYLFGVIHKFHYSADKAELEVLLAIPNAVRQFVELYSYARVPHFIKGTVDHRIETLFGSEKSKRILKVLHHFSHLNDIGRLSKNTDLICDIENAVTELMELLEKDTMHFNALKESLA
ncbi:MAG: AAA family ATPase [Pseudomonadota bacterium]|nr:AAA family ATPase [Pseudomonadota bacterium]